MKCQTPILKRGSLGERALHANYAQTFCKHLDLEWLTTDMPVLFIQPATAPMSVTTAQRGSASTGREDAVPSGCGFGLKSTHSRSLSSQPFLALFLKKQLSFLSHFI
jgi:hypothetical protein